MRKIIFILLIFLFTIGIDEVLAKSLIEEEIEVNWSHEGKISSVNVLLNIPKDCNNKVLNISSMVFSTIKHYKELVGGDNIKINFIIENNSSYNYSYLDNSLFVGVNRNISLDEVVSYRAFNVALKDLYNYVRVYDSDLVDEVLYSKLSQEGYLGDRALELYYLDYYNKKYHMNKKRLEDFPAKVIREIFSGDNYGIYETDKVVNKLAYDYFYKNVLFVTFLFGRGSSGFKYSIFDTNKKWGDVSFKNNVNLIKRHSSKKVSGMMVSMSLDNYTSSFSHYNYFVDVKFKLGMLD